MPHTASPDTTTSPTASTLTCTQRSSGTAPSGASCTASSTLLGEAISKKAAATLWMDRKASTSTPSARAISAWVVASMALAPEVDPVMKPLTAPTNGPTPR